MFYDLRPSKAVLELNDSAKKNANIPVLQRPPLLDGASGRLLTAGTGGRTGEPTQDHDHDLRRWPS